MIKNKENISNLHKIWKRSNYELYLTKVGSNKREDKIFNNFLEKNKLKNSLIISDKNSKSNIIKSARNIPNLKIVDQIGANAYDLLKYKNVIFTTSSIKLFQDRIIK